VRGDWIHNRFCAGTNAQRLADDGASIMVIGNNFCGGWSFGLSSGIIRLVGDLCADFRLWQVVLPLGISYSVHQGDGSAFVHWFQFLCS
jgi:hypothetical protein